MYARPVLCPTLTGRQEEMAIIDQAVAAVRSGRGGSLLLVGEAGIGKSRLAREASLCAEGKSVRVFWGRCVEGGQASPYRPLAEALLSGLRGHALPDVPELRPFRPILGRLIPAWRSETPVEESDVLLGEAILRLLRAVGGDHGSLLVIEDLHWADPETLRVVEYLSANLRQEPLLLLGTLRLGEQSPAGSLATSLRSRRVGDVLELRRLTRDETTSMAEACLAATALPEPLQAGLLSSADGLPLLVEDLLAEWIAAGQLIPAGDEWRVDQDLVPVVPVTFRETVQRRLGELGTPSTELLRLAALLGRRFDWRILPEAAGLSEAQVLTSLRQAVQLQLIRVEAVGRETVFSFRHALTRNAVLEDLLPPERARLAERLLNILETAFPGLPEGWCELAAQLAEQAGDRAQAAAFLLESGRRALSRGALSTAEATFIRAAVLCPPDTNLAADVDEALVDALALAGKHEAVADAGAALLELLARLKCAPLRSARAHLQMARAFVAASGWEAAGDHLGAARELASAGGDALLPSVDAVAAHVAIGQGRLEVATELAGAALLGAEEAELWEVACEALEVAGRVARDQDLRQAEAAFDRARRVAEEHDLAIWRVRAMHELGTIDIFTPGAGPDRLLEARELAEHSGALGLAAMVDVQLAAVETARGDFDAVLRYSSRSVEMARRLGLDITLAVALLFTAEAYSRRGPDRRAMEAAIDAGLQAARADPLFEVEAQGWAWGDARAIASLVEGDLQRAMRELDKAMEFLRQIRGGAPTPAWGLWALLRTLEHHDEARARDEAAASPAMIHPLNQAWLRYAEAISLGRQGRPEDAARAVTAGDALLSGSAAWCMHFGRRLIAEEALDHGWGNPAGWLTEAAPVFDQCGQPRIASACRSLLRKAGGPVLRPARAHPSVPPALRARGVTGREMEVLSIVGEGLSNREIGARLYLSSKTVEKHISSLMDKLEVRSRAQLAAIAASGTIPA